MFLSMFDKMFRKSEEKNIKAKTSLIDLSAVADDVLMLILLRVRAKDLVKNCTKVSKQWNRILAQKHFWKDKMKQDLYPLEWRKLVGLSTESYKAIAVRRAFGRNFLKDSWNMSIRSAKCLKLDPRWNASRIAWKPKDKAMGIKARIEIPPLFLDGQPDIPAELGEPIEACLALGYFRFRKSIVIKLSDEGLTDEIMDNFCPTIVISEIVGNRRDRGSQYEMKCSLKMDAPPIRYNAYVEEHDAVLNLRFAPGQAERWNKVEHVFKEYPPGMRYLLIQCVGNDSQNFPSNFGVKLAKCSVKALCEKNALE